MKLPAPASTCKTSNQEEVNTKRWLCGISLWWALANGTEVMHVGVGLTRRVQAVADQLNQCAALSTSCVCLSFLDRLKQLLGLYHLVATSHLLHLIDQIFMLFREASQSSIFQSNALAPNDSLVGNSCASFRNNMRLIESTHVVLSTNLALAVSLTALSVYIVGIDMKLRESLRSRSYTLASDNDAVYKFEVLWCKLGPVAASSSSWSNAVIKSSTAKSASSHLVENALPMAMEPEYDHDEAIGSMRSTTLVWQESGTVTKQPRTADTQLAPPTVHITPVAARTGSLAILTQFEDAVKHFHALHRQTDALPDKKTIKKGQDLHRMIVGSRGTSF
ncbi:hypothetical protein EJ05DRAFT_488909 [Pseudovirgaria hyperparasitica]|uniref:Uncharacterized protein n=1 Tax=Pseudovirgaria hyperparasitica TaxID=470096 RepID=A0A6A6VZK6_9PEZI|nr:uncharacterized protein EJ05DRAFT_488909 [Pseudovirgaria hyperparasitica]KAF2754757.1 hypothetical protein EJ05DRAFT_488909 [Pseudovirgaria hyperparasitica]